MKITHGALATAYQPLMTGMARYRLLMKVLYTPAVEQLRGNSSHHDTEEKLYALCDD